VEPAVFQYIEGLCDPVPGGSDDRDFPMASSSNRLRSLATLARATRPLLGRRRNRLPFRRRLAPRDAYRLWSETYDLQRANPVLALEDQIRTGLLSKAEVADKVVIDIGVGTGRHWSDVVSRGPRELYGVDISREMLDRLRERFPGAAVHERTSTKLDAFPERSVDRIVSSLMLVYTDFHPEALRAGARSR
jgi:SAM-dependent methyltransferase